MESILPFRLLRLQAKAIREKYVPHMRSGFPKMSVVSGTGAGSFPNRIHP
jgi:hypothetical protein